MKKRNRFWAGVLCLAMVFSLLGTLFVQAEEPLKYTSDTLEIYVANGKTEVKISNLAASFEGKTILCAWYGEDMLMDVRYGLYQSPGISMVSDIKYYDAVRLFYWDSFGNMTPLSAVTAVAADRWAEESDSVKVFSWDDLAKAAQTDSTTQDVTLFFYDETGQEAMCLVSKNADFIYNGVTTSPLDITVADFFSDEEILRENTYLGSITLLEYNENQTGFDGVEVDLGVSAVVQDFSVENGLSFKAAVNMPVWNFSRFEYTRESRIMPEDMLSVTEHGVTYDANRFKEWDVVIVKPSLDAESFSLDKVGDDHLFEGRVTASRVVENYGEYKLSDGNWYTLVSRAYTDASLSAGAEGLFVLYEGHILLYSQFIHVDYAYILDAKTITNVFGETTVSLTMMDQTGTIKERPLSDKVNLRYIDRMDSALIDMFENHLGNIYGEDFTFSVEKCSTEILSALASTATNRLVEYKLDSEGAVRRLVFEQRDYWDGTTYLIARGTGVYNPDYSMIGNAEIDEATDLFFIGGDAVYGEPDLANKNNSGVGDISWLTDQTYTYFAFGPIDDNAKAVVLMNVDAKTPAIQGAGPAAKVLKNANDHYGYVLNAAAEDAGLILRILDEEGGVYDLATAQTFMPNNMENTTPGTAMAEALVNRLVRFSTNQEGQITTLTYEQNTAGQAMYLAAQGKSNYAASTASLGSVTIDANTVIFSVINDYLSVSYGGLDRYNLADADLCGIQDTTFLNDGITYNFVAFDTKGANNTASAVVLLNAQETMPENTPIAVIDTVGMGTNDDGDYIFVVSFYMNGRKMEAVTTPHTIGVMELSEAKCGDVFQLKVKDGTITVANGVLTFYRGYTSTAYKAGELPTLDFLAKDFSKTTFTFGVATKMDNLNTVTVHSIDSLGLSNETSVEKISEDTCIYVYNPNNRPGLEISTGYFSDLYVNDELLKPGATVDFTDETMTDIAIQDGTEAYGLFDCVLVRSYDNQTKDMVIYKAYDFEYTIR